MPRIVPDPHLQLSTGNRSVAAAGEGAQVVLIQIGQCTTGTERFARGDVEVVGGAVTDNQFHPNPPCQGMVKFAHHDLWRVEIRRTDDDLRARHCQQGAQRPIQWIATAHTQQRDHLQALPRHAGRYLVGHASQPCAQTPNVAAQAAGGRWRRQVEARCGGVVQQTLHQADHGISQCR
ncbi:hypothetical protein D9M71_534150 [compost metagenome]